MPTSARAGPGRSQEPGSIWSPTWRQGPRSVSHPLRPPKMHISRKLDQKRSQDSSGGALTWATGIPRGGRTTTPDASPIFRYRAEKSPRVGGAPNPTAVSQCLFSLTHLQSGGLRCRGVVTVLGPDSLFSCGPCPGVCLAHRVLGVRGGQQGSLARL